MSAIYNSSLASAMDAYIQDVKERGRQVKNADSPLRNFDRYLTSIGYDKTYVTEEVYANWCATLTNLNTRTVYTYKMRISLFCKYLNLVGRKGYVPISPREVQCHHIPYIFTHEEMRRLFDVVDSWRDRAYPAGSIAFIMPVLLRVLYSTAARIGEVLQIRNKDIDFGRKVIVLRFTKNHVDRLIPINESLEKVLKQYMEYRSRLGIKDVNVPNGLLFTNMEGKPCRHQILWSRFQIILEIAGIPDQRVKYPPRIHDIRHTACVHSLSKMIQSGRDVYCCMPMLCSFMGHKEVSSTEYYLRLTKEVYPDLIQVDSIATSQINEIISRTLNINFHNETEPY